MFRRNKDKATKAEMKAAERASVTGSIEGKQEIRERQAAEAKQVREEEARIAEEGKLGTFSKAAKTATEGVQSVAAQASEKTSKFGSGIKDKFAKLKNPETHAAKKIKKDGLLVELRKFEKEIQQKQLPSVPPNDTLAAFNKQLKEIHDGILERIAARTDAVYDEIKNNGKPAPESNQIYAEWKQWSSDYRQRIEWAEKKFSPDEKILYDALQAKRLETEAEKKAEHAQINTEQAAKEEKVKAESRFAKMKKGATAIIDPVKAAAEQREADRKAAKESDPMRSELERLANVALEAKQKTPEKEDEYVGKALKEFNEQLDTIKNAALNLAKSEKRIASFDHPTMWEQAVDVSNGESKTFIEKSEAKIHGLQSKLLPKTQSELHEALKTVITDHIGWGKQVRFGGQPILFGSEKVRVPTGIEAMIRVLADAPERPKQSRISSLFSKTPPVDVAEIKEQKDPEVIIKQLEALIKIANERLGKEGRDLTTPVSQFYTKVKKIAENQLSAIQKAEVKPTPDQVKKQLENAKELRGVITGIQKGHKDMHPTYEKDLAKAVEKAFKNAP